MPQPGPNKKSPPTRETGYWLAAEPRQERAAEPTSCCPAWYCLAAPCARSTHEPLSDPKLMGELASRSWEAPSMNAEASGCSSLSAAKLVRLAECAVVTQVMSRAVGFVAPPQKPPRTGGDCPMNVEGGSHPPVFSRIAWSSRAAGVCAIERARACCRLAVSFDLTPAGGACCCRQPNPRAGTRTVLLGACGLGGGSSGND
mmetsp:Transcript_6781/g.11548  ORF Transcript_6781/g.11548 Transcript_6781/m.11548 type:complete len:201 (+) Transcript_6781:977-1579(+)